MLTYVWRMSERIPRKLQTVVLPLENETGEEAWRGRHFHFLYYILLYCVNIFQLACMAFIAKYFNKLIC